MCVNITANIDEEVECEEDFTVELGLFTSGDNLNLINTATAVTVIDINGAASYPISHKDYFLMSFFLF